MKSLSLQLKLWHLRLSMIIISGCFLFFCVATETAQLSDLSGSSVDGSFRILSQQDVDRFIEFHARRSLDGNVSGETIFRADSVNPPSAANGESQESQPFFFKAAVDCLVINKQTAVISGAITDSSSRPYIGRRILVVAQDNGGAEDQSKKDRFTWGIYRLDNHSWLPSDSERSPDDINPLSWIATDSERPDDEGVVSNKEQVIGCQSFPLSSFSFINPSQGHGTVRVRP